MVSDPEILKILNMKNLSQHGKLMNVIAEIQGNFQVLTAERDKILSLYERVNFIYICD